MGNDGVSPKDLYSNIPNVLTIEDFNAFLRQNGPTEQDPTWLINMPHSIPPANVPCACCGEKWTVESSSQAQKTVGMETMRLDDFVGRTFSEFRQALAQKTDAVYIVQSDSLLRNDRFIDLSPDPRYLSRKVNEDGWLARLEGDDAYVIQSGDESLVNVFHYFHPNCHAETLRKGIEERFTEIRERMKAGDESESKGNANLNLEGKHPNVATLCCRQELTQVGISSLNIEPRGQLGPKVTGVLRYSDNTTVYFERAWCYWMVTSSKPLPKEDASLLNRQFGEVVRVNGVSGGTSVTAEGVSSWHVDTDLGLYALVTALNRKFGEPISG